MITILLQNHVILEYLISVNVYYFLSKILLPNDLSQIQEMYHEWTNGITIYISDQLDYIKLKKQLYTN